MAVTVFLLAYSVTVTVSWMTLSGKTFMMPLVSDSVMAALDCSSFYRPWVFLLNLILPSSTLLLTLLIPSSSSSPSSLLPRFRDILTTAQTLGKLLKMYKSREIFSPFPAEPQAPAMLRCTVGSSWVWRHNNMAALDRQYRNTRR